MKGNDLIKAVGIVIVVIVVGFAAKGLAYGPSSVTGDVTTATNTRIASGDVQKVTLSMTGYEYVVEPSVLTKDVPVEMTVDLSTVYGCMRDVVISHFGVNKYVKEGDNIITFTPDKTGTFPIVCSMNMGRGKFSVVEAGQDASDASEELTVAAPVATGGCDGSCGGGCGGGCDGAGGAVGACGI